MRLRIVAAFAVAALTLTAMAQEVERGPEGRARRGEFRRGPSLEQLVERMKSAIEFDEQQLSQLDELLKKHQEQAEQGRARWRELREAEEMGDEARAAQLREEFRAQRAEGGMRGRGPDALLNEVEALLHEDQLEAFRTFRESLPPPPDRGPGEAMMRAIRDLPDAVQMTDEQRAQYDKLLEERRAAMRERWGRRGRGEGEGAQPPAPAAPGEPAEGAQPAEAGDRPPRFERFDPSAMLDELFAQVAEMLNADQVKLLEEYRKQVGSELRDPGGRGGNDPRAVISAAKRVSNLSTEQEDAIREIENETAQAARGVPRSDAEGQAMIAADAKEKILKVLNDEQKAEFERNLQRTRSRGPREGRGPDGPPPPPDQP
ncbi:MAG: hypothetical protein HRF50_10695 [Phycisphaerae bacterium]